MVRLVQNILIMIGFAGLLAYVLPLALDHGKHSAFLDKVSNATPKVLVHERILYVEYDTSIVNHCDVTIVPFLSNNDVDVTLKTVLIPKDKAVADYPADKPSFFVWQLENTVPSGQYYFQTHVISECGAVSTGSTKTKDALVDIPA